MGHCKHGLLDGTCGYCLGYKFIPTNPSATGNYGYTAVPFERMKRRITSQHYKHYMTRADISANLEKTWHCGDPPVDRMLREVKEFFKELGADIKKERKGY